MKYSFNKVTEYISEICGILITSNTDILMFHRFVTVMTLLAFTVMTLCDGQRAADTTALCFLFQDIVSDFSDGEPKKMMAF